ERDALGMKPTTYQRGGAGLQIRYAVADCPLGRLLVAATPRGICALYLGDQDAELQSALRSEYPGAEVLPDEGDLSAWTAAVVRRIEGDPTGPELPLDLRGTAFQERVWKALQCIPRGETRTYGQIAAELGQPGAARAVGRACAT